MSEEEVELNLCDLPTFKKVLKDNPEVAISVTQDGCAYCPEFKEVLEKEFKSRETPLIDMELFSEAEDPCNVVADELKVKVTPTVILFREGKEAGRLEGSGDKVKDSQELRRLLSSPREPRQPL